MGKNEYNFPLKMSKLKKILSTSDFKCCKEKNNLCEFTINKAKNEVLQKTPLESKKYFSSTFSLRPIYANIELLFYTFIHNTIIMNRMRCRSHSIVCNFC